MLLHDATTTYDECNTRLNAHLVRSVKLTAHGCSLCGRWRADGDADGDACVRRGSPRFEPRALAVAWHVRQRFEAAAGSALQLWPTARSR